MAGQIDHRRHGVVVMLAMLVSGPVLGQAPMAPQIELYYGTTHVVPVPAELPAIEPAHTVPVNTQAEVVPAIAQYTMPLTPEVKPRIPASSQTVTSSNRHGTEEVARDGAPSISAAAATLLERLGDRLCPTHESQPAVSVSFVSPTPVAPQVPASLPSLAASTPLSGTETPTETKSEISPRTVTVTTDRLWMLLAVAIGVALGLGGIGVACLLMRRPEPTYVRITDANPRHTPVPAPPASPRPIEISEKGLPKGAEPPDAVDNIAPPERFDPGMLASKAAKAAESNRPRAEESVMQFILDQNLAMLSALGSARDEVRLAADFASPVRLS